MISTVVVPLDGSAGAERALGPARRLSDRFGASMLLFRPAGDDGDIVAAYLDEQAARQGDRSVRTLAHTGFASSGLAEVVARLPDPAVCMAADFAAPPDAVLGPVGEDAIGTGAPVVLVGPSAESRTGPGHGALVVCSDGSWAASSVEPVAAEWARALDLDVHVLTVLDAETIGLDDVPVDRVLREVQHLAARLEHQGLAVRWQVLRNGRDPAVAIARHAADHAGLIAISSRGHRRQVHGVVGDTVLRVIGRAKVPVLVARPQDTASHTWLPSHQTCRSAGPDRDRSRFTAAS